MVLVGYCLTLCLQARGGHPRGEKVRPTALSRTSRDEAA
jgi:hypothetical protein